MARKKPYTRKLAVLDLVLCFLTGGLWLFGILVRELFQRS